jgi:Protein of unknown function (DUF5672)
MLKPPLPADARTALAQVTLCCIDTRSPELALYAMRRSMQHLAFSRCVLISSAQARHLDLDGIDLVEIAPLKSIDDYSAFVIKRLADHVQTSHVLLIQWDGFVRDARMWSDDFLNFDYIGAPWTSKALANQVGNGGFTLRSRKLLQALQSSDYAAHNPEDVCIAVTHRARLESEHRIRFADVQTARRFACERGPWRTAFGFHAVFNLPHVLSSAELVQFSAALPAHLTASSDARHLIRDLIRQGEFESAQTLLRKRTQHLGWHADAWRQKLQLTWARLRRMI